ncbi:glycosyltransferase involved in cell wall biosynthesis [Neomicrococcus aestuarii]|uniref:Glycosyltransferase involved in cell wall biosynthesis n=1 Tax=Neomicrococcus aestuarii TaxID=556325 RepID=A0A7W8TR25_9MICC|nr:glycosyltransferase [Neomicrococcus aestuarii]MBB5511361.1 glycosyltransferase involved in cell wall biosynthesis [Neomicrococcus aestuarii]
MPPENDQRLSLAERARQFALKQEIELSDLNIENMSRRLVDLQFRYDQLREAEINQSEQLRLAQARASQFKNQLEDLRTNYEKQLARATKFKSAYESMKQSPDFKIGRLLAAPTRRLRKLVGKSTIQLSGNNSGVDRTSDSVSLAVSPTKNLVTSTRREIDEAKRRYVKDGEVVAPLEVLESFEEHLHDNERVLLEQMRGVKRLLENLFDIPPRQFSAGYVPKRGRVIYCAHSTGHYNSNGYSTRTAGLTSALGKISDIVVVARPGYPWDSSTRVPAENKDRYTQIIGDVTHVFNNGPSLRRDPVDLYIHRSADILAREATIQRAELIHSASNHLTALPALIAARRLGIPFVYEVRGLWELTEASNNEKWASSERFQSAVRLETQVAIEADRVLAITSQVKEELIRRGVREDRIELLPNAADTVEFAPVPKDRGLLRSRGISENDVVIGYAGSIVAYEGLDTLVEGFSKASIHSARLKLLIVGDGKDLGRVREIVKANNLEDRVIFTGRIPSQQVPKHVNLMDVVVCPRRSNTVTEMVSPIKPLEAFAAGKAVIVSNVGPLVELVGQDQDRGLIFEAGEPEDLSRKIRTLIEDSETRTELGRKARSWTRQTRDWSEMARIVRHAYAAVFEESKRASTSLINESEPRSISDLRLALISDEFTYHSVKSECEVIQIHPDSWKEVLSPDSIDALLIESAWEGNNGSWHRKVGYYDDDSFSTIVELTDWCRKFGIPTLFWNKEDPVHFERFRKTASLVDHVFTTDSNMIPKYFSSRGSENKTYSALPFWAQPSIHNPFPPRGSRKDTVAYGGSFYGERYPERSHSLQILLNSVAEHGLTIYDRQANHPESPYRYPQKLVRFVQGGLKYSEMLDAYKQHPLHLNVNSVVNSPTMFSRRVVELAACGTPIISGPGAGVDYLFGDLVPTTESGDLVGKISNLWMNNERDRILDGWNLHRHVYRAHLAQHRLAYMLRTAGIKLQMEELPRYRLRLDALTAESTASTLRQSLLPNEVVVGKDQVLDKALVERLNSESVSVDFENNANDDELLDVYLGNFLDDSEAAEDLVRTSFYWPGRIQITSPAKFRNRHSLWEFDKFDKSSPALNRGVGSPASAVTEGDQTAVLALVRPREELSAEPQVSPKVEVSFEPKRIVLAGHDLKFASTIVQGLRNAGHDVRIDQWTGHATHDELLSEELSLWSNVVFCEWALGNLEWYSSRRRPGQKLITRFHSQELFWPYMERIHPETVDKFVFVGEFVRQRAMRQFGIPYERTVVIPNALGVEPGLRKVDSDNRFRIGFVGSVPRQKHLDRALDILEMVRKQDTRFELHVKGRRPEEYSWMLDRPDELAFYQEQYARIEQNPLLTGSVHFDPHGDDMSEWYSQIGVVLSLSDFESFHMTLADGAASGAVPLSLSWPGAELIYPVTWIHDEKRDIANHLLEVTADELNFEETARGAQMFALGNFATKSIVDTYLALIAH